MEPDRQGLVVEETEVLSNLIIARRYAQYFK